MMLDIVSTHMSGLRHFSFFNQTTKRMSAAVPEDIDLSPIAWQIPLIYFQYYADIVCGSLSILGALWVIGHCRHSIMKNIPGFIITAIAFCDLMVALSWSVLENVLKLTDSHIYLDTTFYYFNGIYAFLCCILALVALYIVRYQGSTAMLEKNKWWAIMACLVFPFPVISGTLAIIIHQPILNVMPVACYDPAGDVDGCLNGSLALYLIMLCLISLSALICIASYWITFKSISKAKATPAVQLMTRLILAYLAMTVVLFISTISYFLFAYIQLKMAQDQVGMTLSYKIVTYLASIMDILSASRGYFHALVVSFMYSSLNGKPLWKRILLPILLVAPLITKDNLRQPPQIANNSTSTTLECSSSNQDSANVESSFGMQKSFIVPLMPSFQRSFRKFGTFMSRPRFGMAESNDSVFP